MQQRQLGAWESGFQSAHDLLNGTMLVVARAAITGVYNTAAIREAWYILFHRHPLLRAIIETRNYNGFFVLSADFKNIPITVLEDASWQQQFEQEIHQPLQSEKYLWRVKILKTHFGFELLFTIHHAIADALSVVTLLEQFMEVYSDLLQNKLPIIKPLVVLNNVENCLKETTDWHTFEGNYKKFNADIVDQIPYATTAPISARHSHSHFTKIDKVTLGRILINCKKNNVTLNSFLNAVMLFTQVQLNPEYTHASLKTPVNLRTYCEPKISTENIGCFLSIVETKHEIKMTGKNIWTVAQEFQAQLQEKIPILGFLPAVFDHVEIDVALAAQLFGVAGAKRRTFLPNTFGISNIGKLAIKTKFPNLELNDFVFSTNHLVGNYYMFLSALTLHDELNLIFAYVTPLIHPEKAAVFIKLFKEHLL